MASLPWLFADTQGTSEAPRSLPLTTKSPDHETNEIVQTPPAILSTLPPAVARQSHILEPSHRLLRSLWVTGRFPFSQERWLPHTDYVRGRDNQSAHRARGAVPQTRMSPVGDGAHACIGRPTSA